MKDDVDIDLRRVCEAMKRPFPSVEELGFTQVEYNKLSLEEEQEAHMRWFAKWVKTLKHHEARRLGYVISMLMLEDKGFNKSMRKQGILRRGARKRMKKKVLG